MHEEGGRCSGNEDGGDDGERATLRQDQGVNVRVARARCLSFGLSFAPTSARLGVPSSFPTTTILLPSCPSLCSNAMQWEIHSIVVKNSFISDFASSSGLDHGSPRKRATSCPGSLDFNRMEDSSPPSLPFSCCGGCCFWRGIIGRGNGF